MNSSGKCRFPLALSRIVVSFFFMLFFLVGINVSPVYAAISCIPGVTTTFTPNPISGIADATIVTTISGSAALGVTCANIKSMDFGKTSPNIMFCNMKNVCGAALSNPCINGWNCSSGQDISCSENNTTKTITLTRTLASGTMSQDAFFFDVVVPRVIQGNTQLSNLCPNSDFKVIGAPPVDLSSQCSALNISFSPAPLDLNKNTGKVTIGNFSQLLNSSTLTKTGIGFGILLNDGSKVELGDANSFDAASDSISFDIIGKFQFKDVNLNHSLMIMARSVGVKGYWGDPLCPATTFFVSDGTTKEPPLTTASDFIICKQTVDAETKGHDYQECTKCFDSGALWTAFGCVGRTKEGIVTSFIRIGIGISGGFVLLSILYGSFLITTSSGDPKRVEEGQEMITSAVMGLIFVIFSIIILRFIGVSILQIPGFGT